MALGHVEFSKIVQGKGLEKAAKCVEKATNFITNLKSHTGDRLTWYLTVNIVHMLKVLIQHFDDTGRLKNLKNS